MGFFLIKAMNQEELANNKEKLKKITNKASINEENSPD